MTFAFYDMKKYTLTKTTIMSLSFLYLLAFSRAISSRIGVNLGRLGNNIPSASRSVELLQTMKAGRVRLYDAEHELLHLLSGTKIEVTITVTNDEVSGIANNQELANQWISEHILNHYPGTLIRSVLVGNNTNTDQDMKIIEDSVSAMTRIRTTLKALGINNIKVGTSFAMDIMESTFPPSSGRFKPDIVHEIVPLLSFLRGTKSYFFLDVYPYVAWANNSNSINLDYALFEGNQTYTDPANGLNYTNLLDQMLDSVYFAMANLGYNDVMIAIAETGWPHEGDLNQQGVSKENAAMYNRNVIRKMTAVPSKGTPVKPGVIIPTFISSLYDENEKSGPEFERHLGLLNPDGSAVYEVDLSGKTYN